MAIEHKVFSLTEVKLAEPGADEASAKSFSGYGAFFGNVDSYGDVIEAGAFQETIASARKSGNWPAMLSQHGAWAMTSEDMTPVGIWTDMGEDGKGLKMDGVLADTARGQDLYTLMKMKPRPAINGLSIGYIPKKFTMGTKPSEPRRTLHQVELIEVSLVTFPANGKARVSSVKSAADFTDREFEQLMQDAGLSRKEARIVMTHGFRHLKAMQDAGSEELDQLAQAIKRNTAILTNT